MPLTNIQIQSIQRFPLSEHATRKSRHSTVNIFLPTRHFLDAKCFLNFLYSIRSIQKLQISQMFKSSYFLQPIKINLRKEFLNAPSVSIAWESHILITFVLRCDLQICSTAGSKVIVVIVVDVTGS